MKEITFWKHFLVIWTFSLCRWVAGSRCGDQVLPTGYIESRSPHSFRVSLAAPSITVSRRLEGCK